MHQAYVYRTANGLYLCWTYLRQDEILIPGMALTAQCLLNSRLRPMGLPQHWIHHQWYPEVLGPAPQLNNFFTSFEDLENNLVLIQKPVVAYWMACEGSWSYQTSVPIAHDDTNSASALVSSQSSVPTRASAGTADLLMDGACACLWDRWVDLPSTLNSCSYYFSLVLHNL